MILVVHWVILVLDVFPYPLDVKPLQSNLHVLLDYKSRMVLDHSQNVVGMALHVLIKHVQLLLELHQQQLNVVIINQVVLPIIQLMDQFQDVKIYQQLVQLEDQLKIVKSQEVIFQHVYGILLHLHVLKNLVLLLVLQQLQDSWPISLIVLLI